MLFTNNAMNNKNTKPIYIPRRKRLRSTTLTTTTATTAAAAAAVSAATEEGIRAITATASTTTSARTSRKQQFAAPTGEVSKPSRSDRQDNDVSYGRPQHGNASVGIAAAATTTATTAAATTTAAPKHQQQQEKQQQQQFALHELMDDRDHNEWGGPQKLTRTYQKRNGDTEGGETTPWTDLWSVPATTSSSFGSIGDRLLRYLGWRPERGVAYVTAARGMANEEDDYPTTALTMDMMTISQKRLRKIQLQQQQQAHIPQPKLDHAGLGFDPFQDAPEFEQHHQERRRRRAQQQHQASSLSLSAAADVYRVDNLFDMKQLQRPNNPHSNNDLFDNRNNDDSNKHNDLYISAETLQDFIGNKSASGFALRDDDDQAYDDGHDDDGDDATNRIMNNGNKQQQQQLAIAYEHVESDPENDDVAYANQSITDSKRASMDFASVLSAWATDGTAGSSKTAIRPRTAFTANGQAVLKGFVLGGVDPDIAHCSRSASAVAGNVSPPSSTYETRRFRGPDLPAGFQVARHVFASHDSPAVWQTLSHAVHLERRSMTYQPHDHHDALPPVTKVHKPSSSEVPQQNATRMLMEPPKNIFAGISEAMKNRFTPARSHDSSMTATATTTSETAQTRPAGLSRPLSSSTTAASAAPESNISPSKDDPLHVDNANNKKKPITIVRSIQTFHPEPLLCKRLHVVVAQHLMSASGRGNNIAARDDTQQRTREEAFFQDEVFSRTKSGKTQTAGYASDDIKSASKSHARGMVPPTSLHELQQPPDDAHSAASPNVASDMIHPLWAQRPSISVYKSIYQAADQGSATDLDALSTASSPSSPDAVAAVETTGVSNNLESDLSQIEHGKENDAVENDRSARDVEPNDIRKRHTEESVLARPSACDDDTTRAAFVEHRLVVYNEQQQQQRLKSKAEDASSSDQSRKQRRRKRRRHRSHPSERRSLMSSSSWSAQRSSSSSSSEHRQSRRRKRRHRDDGDDDSGDQSPSHATKKRRKRSKDNHKISKKSKKAKNK